MESSDGIGRRMDEDLDLLDLEDFEDEEDLEELDLPQPVPTEEEESGRGRPRSISLSELVSWVRSGKFYSATELAAMIGISDWTMTAWKREAIAQGLITREEWNSVLKKGVLTTRTKILDLAARLRSSEFATLREIANVYGVNIQTVSHWRKRAAELGIMSPEEFKLRLKEGSHRRGLQQYWETREKAEQAQLKALREQQERAAKEYPHRIV
jgi:hypothetical protein